MNTENFQSNLNRRNFLKITAAGLGTASLGLAGCSTGPSKRAKIPVGLELYSLRNECKTDFPGTIAAVAKMGYRGVEFAGYWGRSAREIRQMLDDHGLITCGTHTQYTDLQPDKIDATLEFNRVIGNKFVICPYMTGKTRQEWLAKADEFNSLAVKLQPLGMSIGYHAHAHDFHQFEGQTAWDIFFGNTRPEVIMQLDTSNCRDGGADPVEVLSRYPGRARSIHIKPNGGGPDSVIGEDKINWPAVFNICEHQGRTQWYVVEHESSQAPLQTVQRTLAVLRDMGKA